MAERVMTESTGKMRDWIIALTEHDFNWKRVQGLDILDEIEREIAERYMELPVDADGVPIRVGDELEYGHYSRGIAMAVSGTMVVAMRVNDDNLNFAKYGLLWESGGCHHAKPRTLEDVLDDFASAYDRIGGEDDEHQKYLDIVKRYAEEIRELMVVDE